MSAVMFWSGHAIFLADQFASTHIIPSLAILALGFALASLRIWLKTLHLILALHLAFYFIFAEKNPGARAGEVRARTWHLLRDERAPVGLWHERSGSSDD